jgi:hypothetical protein
MSVSLRNGRGGPKTDSPASSPNVPDIRTLITKLNKRLENLEKTITDKIEQKFTDIEKHFWEKLEKDLDDKISEKLKELQDQCIQTKIDDSLKQLDDIAQKKIKEVTEKALPIINSAEELENIKQNFEPCKQAQDELLLKLNLIEGNVDKALQSKNKNSIVITGLPSNISDIKSTFIDLLKKIEIDISPNDISNTFKQNKIIDRNTKKTNYIVQLNNLELRNEVLAKKKKRHIFADQINLASEGNNEIFFRNNLTPFQKRLHYQAKLFQKEHNFKYLWVKNENIWIRENESSKPRKIENFNNINSLFKEFAK